ncbi:MAG: antibiotic biosynthesis monooxygenase [Balneolaceae bacterium]|nr:antibiotic biosynthesis monooxygenase [Balneolaceae bacterium]
MVARIWHGWTKPENAENYKRLLEEVIFPGIAAKNIQGYKKIELLCRPLDNEVAFITIMWFESWDAIKTFAGENYSQAYVPQEARELLSRFDTEAQHYEMITTLSY